MTDITVLMRLDDEEAQTELVGKAALVRNVQESTVFEAMTIRVRLVEPALGPYINAFLRTGIARSYFSSVAKQAIGQASINPSQVASLPIPIPPLVEQYRIVARVDELTSLIDRLEVQLTSQTGLHQAFAAAAVHHLDV